jgi:hypothetical protein
MFIPLILTSACGVFNREATPEAPPLPEDIDPLVDLAVFDLALENGLEIEDIQVVSVEETEFNDASLGVPTPGLDYAQVLTPGLIIELEARGERYLYHASGNQVVRVPSPNEE